MQHHPDTATILAERSAVEIQVDRLCRLADRYRDSNPRIRSHALHRIDQMIPQQAIPIDDSQRDLKYMATQADSNVAMAVRRSRSALADFHRGDDDDAPAAIQICINMIVMAAAVIHHSNQAEHNPNPLATATHLAVANIGLDNLMDSMQYLHDAIQSADHESLPPELVRQVTDDVDQALHCRSTLIAAARRAMPVQTTDLITRHVDSNHVNRFVEQFRASQRPMEASMISQPDGAHPLVLLVFEYDNAIRVKFAEEPYPVGFPDYDAIQHAQIIAQQANIFANQPDPANQQTAVVLSQTANHIVNATHAGLHAVQVQGIAELIDTIAQTNPDPGFLYAVIELICHGDPDTTHEMATQIGRADLVTDDQADTIIATARNAGATPAVVNRITAAINRPVAHIPTDLNQRDIIDFLTVAKRIGLPPQTALMLGEAVSEGQDDPTELCIMAGYEPDEPEDSSPAEHYPATSLYIP